MELISGKEDFYRIYSRPLVYILTPFTKVIKGAETLSQVHSIRSRQMAAFNGRLEVLEEELKNYVQNGYSVTIVVSTKERLDNMRNCTARIGMEGQEEFRWKKDRFHRAWIFPIRRYVLSVKMTYLPVRNRRGEERRARRRLSRYRASPICTEAITSSMKTTV